MIYYRQVKTRRGSDHPVNQDRYLLDEYRINGDINVIQVSVADGVSKSTRPEKAAWNSIRECHHSFHGRLLDKYDEERDGDYSISIGADFVKAALVAAIDDANAYVCDSTSGFAASMSTLSTVVLVDTYAVIANAGDSPVYYYRAADNHLILASKIQTQAEEKILTGESSFKRGDERYWEEAHILKNGLGISREKLPEPAGSCIYTPLNKGDFFLIGSDGAFGRLLEEEILEIVKDFRTKPAGVILDQLFQRGREHGDDDQTAILLSVEGV